MPGIVGIVRRRRDSQSEPQPVKCRTVYSGAFSVPSEPRSKPPGFILPCQPALADRPPSGPGWLHEIKFDGYRVIARKDGEQIRLWARTTSDYSKAFTRIRDAVALPVESAVLDGEAVILRPDNSCDFEALRSRQGQADAILVAYDIMRPGRPGRAPGASGRAQEASGAAAVS
jgi:ATP-dependent DNA ligase